MEIGPASQNIKKKQEVNVTSTKLRHDQHKIMKKNRKCYEPAVLGSLGVTISTTSTVGTSFPNTTGQVGTDTKKKK
jgi:hypothetical protein